MTDARIACEGSVEGGEGHEGFLSPREGRNGARRAVSIFRSHSRGSGKSKSGNRITGVGRVEEGRGDVSLSLSLREKASSSFRGGTRSNKSSSGSLELVEDAAKKSRRSLFLNPNYFIWERSSFPQRAYYSLDVPRSVILHWEEESRLVEESMFDQG